MHVFNITDNPVFIYVWRVCVLHFAALSNLNGVMLYGKKMHVTHSRHAQVQMPQAGSNVIVRHSSVWFVWEGMSVHVGVCLA